MTTTSDLHAATRRAADEFVEIVRTHDLGSPVPDCPGWTLADLGRHLGVVHRWASDIVRSGELAGRTEPPSDPAALADWLAEGASALLDALATTDPQRPTWTFGPPPRLARFWSRRQAHETTMHLRDAQRAVGVVTPLDATVAADGIDEVLTVFFGRQVRSDALRPIEQPIGFAVTDADVGPWVLQGDALATGITPVATVAGTSEALLLALWRRGPWEVLEVDGDEAAIAAFFASALTP